MSLSAMLLHFIKRGVNSEHGIPLGFLSANFQLTSITYFFRKEFRGLRGYYIAVFLGLFGLAMLSGPSSAITMIPRLQFWEM